MAEFKFTRFRSGVNNVLRDDLLNRTQLKKALNVDLLPGGIPKRRKGYQRLLSGGTFHSLYAAPDFLLFVEDGVLKRFDGTGVAVVVHSGGYANPVRYAEVNGEVFSTDSTRTGVVDTEGGYRKLGAETPAGQPSIAAISDGGLFEGLYQVAITYLSKSGAESGTIEASNVSVSEGGGVRLSNIPQPQEAETVAVRVYASDPNGENLYFRTQIPLGQTSYDLGYLQPGKKLDAMFKDRMPAGQAIGFFNGRLYVADNELLAFSDPLDFGRYSILDGYVLADYKILMVRAVTGGVFVATEKGIDFYSGARPADFQKTRVSMDSVIEGSDTLVDGSFFDGELAGRQVAVWWSTEGIMEIGLPDGTVRKIREGELALPSYESGSVAEVDREGVRQLVSVMKNPGTESGLAFGDEAEITVHRNGVEI